jgi:hypothetical protein
MRRVSSIDIPRAKGKGERGREAGARSQEAGAGAGVVGDLKTIHVLNTK